MEQKSVVNTLDGRTYDVTMSWPEKIKDTEFILPISFSAVDKSSGRSLKLPREIATFAIGDPAENIGDRTRIYYGGSRDALVSHCLEMAYRRATDWIVRGK